MTINNIEIGELDIFDADVVEKYEAALKRVEKEAKECNGLSTADTIRKQCNAIFNCFNTLFGEGTDKKIFGDKTNLIAGLKAFDELIDKVNNQKSDLDKLVSKYSPNRAARRTKK